MSAGTQDGLFRQVTNERAAVAKQEKRALWPYIGSSILKFNKKQKGQQNPTGTTQKPKRWMEIYKMIIDE